MRNRFLFVCTSSLDLSISEYQSYNYFFVLFWFSKLHINIYYPKAGTPFLVKEMGHPVEAVGVFYPHLSCYLVKESGPKLLPTEMLVCNWPSCQNPMTPCQRFLHSVILRTGAIEIVPVKCSVSSNLLKSWAIESTPQFPGGLQDFIHITSKRK